MASRKVKISEVNMQAIQNKIIKKSTLYIIYGVFIAILSTLLVSSNFAFADTSVNYNVEIQQALNVTMSSNKVSLDLNPESKPFGTEDLEVSVGTNYINGYRLYINASSPRLLNSTYDTNFYIDTLEDEITTASFPAGFWGYRISSGTGGYQEITDTSTQSSSTKYFPFSSGTLISSANTAVNDNATTLTFASRIDYANPAGTYANVFTFNAVVNPVTYSISYADNSGDATVVNIPEGESGMLTGGVATLSSTVPTRAGYTFSHWCLGTASSSATVCDGTEYEAGGTVDLSQGIGPDIDATLYAIWEADLYTVTIATTNIEANAESLDIPYGGSATVTISPATNYYLSSVSCPTGYTCSGYNTGTSATGLQTITITNDGTTDGGTLTIVGEIERYNITIKTVTGISSVSLNGTSCTSTSGCTVSNLNKGQSYTLTATAATGYSFNGWSAGSYGTIANTSSASTTYTVGAGASTITPAAKINQYTCTKQYRLQNADGSYPSTYTTAGTQSLNYGSTCSYTASVSYYTAQSGTCTVGTSGCTISLSLPRTTNTLKVTNSCTGFYAECTINPGVGSYSYRWGQSITATATVKCSNSTYKYFTGSLTAESSLGHLGEEDFNSVNAYTSQRSKSVKFTMPTTVNAYIEISGSCQNY